MSQAYQTFDAVLSSVGFEERDADHGEGHRQRDVFDAFRVRKHVILHAPTGWGKTFAVLAALGKGHCIYSLPMRSLVDSIEEGANNIGPNEVSIRKCVAQHGARREHKHLDRGTDPDDPIECVFATLDQTLSAFLGIPVGVSMRQGNIMPAVVDASHLVFDEFHLFELERSWTTALFALQRSQQNGIILTATLSDVMVDFLEECLANSVVGEVAVVRGKRPFVNDKTARRGAGLDRVDQLEFGQRTLIIRNQVEWAQHTAEKLRKRDDLGKVYLLHSELLPKDRTRIEQKVRHVFGEDSGESGILVATQVVEAGLDITSDVMHTDLCPPPAFVQRIGRCARYAGETGRIFWHPVETEMPYRGQADEMAALSDFLGDECKITPDAEHEIVNLAEAKDRNAIQNFREGRSVREVSQLRVDPDYSEYRQYIRDINSVDVAIGRDVNRPYNFLSISQSKFYEGGKYDGAKVPTIFAHYDSDRKVFDTVENWLLADFALLSPEHAQYDPEYGIRIGETGGEDHFVGEAQTYTKHGYDSPEAEPYWKHIQRLKDKQPACRWIIERLAKDRHVQSLELAEYLIDFVTWAHDIGKLSYAWQAAHNVSPDGVPIAHSGGEYKRQRKPPWHAWMSAWAVKNCVWETFSGDDRTEKLRKAIFWAIADHHGYSYDEMKSSSLESFTLGYLDHLDQMPEHMAWVRKGWNSSVLTTSISNDRKKLENIFRFMRKNHREPSDANDVYFALSYVLRRTDQLATALLSSEEEVEKEEKSNPRFL